MDQNSFPWKIQLVGSLSGMHSPFLSAVLYCKAWSIGSILQWRYSLVFNLSDGGVWVEYQTYVGRVKVSIVERLEEWFVYGKDISLDIGPDAELESGFNFFAVYCHKL